jgi:hypothetical protein
MLNNRYFVEKETIMGAAQIRELLHEYINKADDRFINLMYAMVQADMKEDDYEMSGTHKKILDEIEHDVPVTHWDDYNCEIPPKSRGRLSRKTGTSYDH